MIDGELAFICISFWGNARGLLAGFPLVCPVTRHNAILARLVCLCSFIGWMAAPAPPPRLTWLKSNWRVWRGVYSKAGGRSDHPLCLKDYGELRRLQKLYHRLTGLSTLFLGL